MKLIIDPGHGGSDPGAVGPSGLRESDVNLTLAFYLEQMHGGDCLLTRRTDDHVSLASRSATDLGADAFISLHCNAADHARAQGFEIWTSHGDTGADTLAAAIFRSVMNSSSPQRRFRSDFSDSDPDKEASFYVLTHTPMPAVLIETAFISNPMEEQMLRDDNFLRLQACAIAAGVRQWTGGQT